MKRLFTLLVAFSLIVAIAGCQNEASDTTPTEIIQPTLPSSQPVEKLPEEETQSTEPAAPAQQPMFSVFVPATTYEHKAADGTVIFRNTYQDMSLIIPDPDVASKIIIDFLNRVENTGTNPADLQEAAESAYTGSSDWLSYGQTTIYSPQRIDQSILSLHGISITYAGSAHPTHLSISANYDMITGDFLTLGNILAAENSIEQLYSLLTQTLKGIQSEKQLYPYYESLVHDILFSDPESYSNWYFSWEGIHFYFSPYEIAPYASGEVDVQIPYSQLLGIISDAYFPPEYSHAGSVQAVLFEEANINDFSQICPVTQTNDAQKILLHSGDTAVSHIMLNTGIFEEGISTIPNYTLFACSTLTPGDAILLETSIPDTIPNLQLTYVSAEETVRKFITQSGKDGSILLID